MADQRVVGFDVATVESWLSTVADVAAPLRWTRLSGGHSNLTYEIRDRRNRSLVIRRPPLGELLPKAHDMWREYRIVDALTPTSVPVARPVAYCDDRAVAETHFYVTDRAPGEPLYTGAGVDAWLAMPSRARAGACFVDTLAALHSIDPDTVGLGDLGRADRYLARQLRTWYFAWTAQVPRAQHDDQRVHDLYELLSCSTPEQGPARIVHGDFGPHNVLFGRSGELGAVLDWELATLGDPLADFAYAINAWVEPGGQGVFGSDPPTARPGFPSRHDLIERYSAATGANLRHLGYYRTFNSWKVGCILHGVYARYRAGQKSTVGVDVDELFDGMNRAIDAAMHQAQELG